MRSTNTEQASIVEISGWDYDENFFVEKTILQHRHDGNKKVAIRARVRAGALVFVRLSEGTLLGRTVPVTYQVFSINNASGDAAGGEREVHLVRLHPKAATGSTLRFTLQGAAPN